MRTGAAFPSNYIKASDLQGKRIVVTIDHVAMESVGREKKDQKPVLYFEGKDKGLVLNVTNAKKITALLGTDEMDEWAGGQIMLFSMMVEFGGEEVEGIRVAAVPKGAPKAAPTPKPLPPAEHADEDFQSGDEDIPFSIVLVPLLTSVLAFGQNLLT